MKIFQKIINHKINSITGKELLKYGKQFQVSITNEQANKIAAHLRGRNVNIFNDDERTKVISEIAKIVGPDKANEINRIFVSFTR
ncbi:DUF2624 domain-containing protein [Robertmurraya massiliosenegalensis]|uniref:DUF2624 domain-containing protein n=1 Tax=Robertmurraya massiliosenegalensis TaxID=1287657 RepID=UPI0002F39309|nr:DUF2624 domain-containing protein [Robertmurraya massiliosenegalensis]